MSEAAIDENILLKVRECFADALGADLEDVQFDTRVIADLGAESLDFLDIAFRLERAFDVRIPRGGVEAASRQQLAEGEVYEVDGVVTAAGLAQLQKYMPEVPPSEFKANMKVNSIAQLFRVGTFYNVVVRLLEEKTKGATAQA